MCLLAFLALTVGGSFLVADFGSITFGLRLGSTTVTVDNAAVLTTVLFLYSLFRVFQ